jgi:acyl-coenzyme A synthetase/AMP-(fatty) acid ligase
MKTPRASGGSLRAILGTEAVQGGARLHAQNADVSFAELARRGPLAPHLGELAGRCVIVAASSQFAAAQAMIDLDGLAARMVLAPPDITPSQLAQAARLAGAHAIVFDRGPPAGTPESLERIAFDPYTRFDRGPADPPRRTQWVMFTSGTSGAPKLVRHDLTGLIGAIRPARASPAAAVWSTFYDIRRYGGLQIFLRAIVGGATMVLSAEHEAPAAFLRRLGALRVSHISGTPSHWRRALMSGEAGAIAPRTVRLSGEIADQPILDALAAAYPKAAIGHAYASTEAGVGFEVTDGREGFPVDFLDYAGGCVELAVAEGTLRVRSRRAAEGYVGAPHLALLDPDGFVDTGDLVERRGDRFYFVGRRGGLINVGGLKVAPEEVEAVINRHPAVTMSLVRARKSPITGAIVVADVVVDPAAHYRDEVTLRAKILSLCRKALPAHKTPTMLRFVPALEVGANGKVVRHDG